VILWDERLPVDALRALASIAARLRLGERQGAGLLEVPAGANGRGLREVGVLPDAGPGYAALDEGAGRGAVDIARAAAEGELSALYLLQSDPLREQRDRALWERALGRAALVVAHASVLTAGVAQHASVVFPAESHAEKEGTVVHPDGRIQRLRAAIAHPLDVRAGWWVLSEVAKRVGLDTGVLTPAMAFAQVVEAVPFYRGLTLEEIGGRGVRWPAREQAAAMPAGEAGQAPSESAQPSGAHNGALRMGTYRPIWAAPEVEVSPALKFAIARQQIELSPHDAARLGVGGGEMVEVRQNGTALRASVAVRDGVPAGTVFLADGIAEDSANALSEPLVEVRRP